MGEKTYNGQLTIRWTTRELQSDGSYRNVDHTEVLHASVTKPYPMYFEETHLFYANDAAPELTFDRIHSGLANKQKSIKFKWTKWRLEKKSKNMDKDYAMMTNEVFETAFNTKDRNNNQQHALLFTPLAQENMLNLLSDEEIGYGDDFDFNKNHKINTIYAKHIQEINLECNPNQYKHFDFEKSKELFCTTNTEAFRAIYFTLAPILCIPLYQQHRPIGKIYGYNTTEHSTFWEHESLANCWGQDYFKSYDCSTENILKTSAAIGPNGEPRIAVYAYGYRAEDRVSYITKYGGDGRPHDVEVKWVEYIPVTGTGTIQINEDNTPDNTIESPSDRHDHINQILSISAMAMYRRHIASKIIK